MVLAIKSSGSWLWNSSRLPYLWGKERHLFRNDWVETDSVINNKFTDGDTNHHINITLMANSLKIIPSDLITLCSGMCHPPPDFQTIRQFANASCTSTPQLCQRKIHQCQGLVCQCCDHVTCFLRQDRGDTNGYHDLHLEDRNVLQISKVRVLNICIFY